MLGKHWDEEGNKFIKGIKIFTIAYQYFNFLDSTGASYARSWLGVIMITIKKNQRGFYYFWRYMWLYFE